MMSAFHKSLRRKVRQELTASQRRHRTRRALKRLLNRFGTLFLWILYCAVAVVWILGAGERPEPLLLLASLFVTLITCLDDLDSRLRCSEWVTRTAFFPVSDERVFNGVWRRYLGGKAVPLLATMWIYAAILTNSLAQPLTWILGATIAVLQVASIVAIQTSVLAYPTRWLSCFPRLTACGLMAVSTLTLAFSLQTEFVAGRLTAHVPWLLAVLPAGWAARSFLDVLSGHLGSASLFLFGATALLVPLPFAYRKLKTAYRIREFDFLGLFHGEVLLYGDRHDKPHVAADLTDSACDPSSLADRQDSDERPLHPTTQEFLWYRVNSSFEPMPIFNWQTHGWLERMVAWLLNTRERLIAELLLDDSGVFTTGWSQRWRKSSLFLALVLSVTAIVPPPFAGHTFLIIALALASVSGAPFFGGYWAGIDLSQGGPAVAARTLPISFREISATVIKTNFTRILVWLPWGLVGGTVAAVQIGYQTAESIELVSKCAYVALVAHPLIFIMRFGSGTTNVRRDRFVDLLSVGAFCIVLVCVLGLSIGLFLLFQVAVYTIAAGAILLLGCSYALWKLYQRWYERGPVDIILVGNDETSM